MFPKFAKGKIFSSFVSEFSTSPRNEKVFGLLKSKVPVLFLPEEKASSTGKTDLGLWGKE